ncbi:hypothetical protein K9M47_02555 [Candidatus Gracilibacteria bacterium]|nr:hypothetical protein [Candidatus Gracilibacteria bacterium]MCF7898767.1 hypothetical protein [Candidatus Paceibacterota bacterium]
MRKENTTQILLLTIFVIFSYVYFKLPQAIPQVDKIYITITTFFFSIFTGFFVSQQMSRYSKIRSVISNFDGRMSGIYRASENISKDVMDSIGKIISKHYKKMMKEGEWNYHLTHKSNTMASIHTILEEKVGDAKVEGLRAQALGKVLNNLSDCEVSRKSMVMLYQERIPAFQWFIITFFILVLILVVSAIPSQGLILESILKSAFCVSILSVASILYHLDNLHLFEDFIGENSAQDVLDLIKGKK